MSLSRLINLDYFCDFALITNIHPRIHQRQTRIHAGQRVTRPGIIRVIAMGEFSR